MALRAPGAIECLQAKPEAPVCDRIKKCESHMGPCESKMNIAAKECWGCSAHEKPPIADKTHQPIPIIRETLDSSQLLKNDARVLKKNIRG